MASAYKVLGQVIPEAATATTLYTVPSATSAVCSTLTICNTSTTTAASFRIAIRPSGATLATVHYLVYDTTIASSDSVFLTLGISLATTDVITVYASTATVTFSLFGAELT